LGAVASKFISTLILGNPEMLSQIRFVHVLFLVNSYLGMAAEARTHGRCFVYRSNPGGLVDLGTGGELIFQIHRNTIEPVSS
jgi:hypothetical protein